MQFRLKGASGEITGKLFPLSDDTLLGGSEDAEIRLDGLDDRHARIVFEDGVLSLESAGECWINGEPVTRRPLQSGDELRIGPHRFVLQAPGLKPARALAKAPRRRISPWTWVLIAALAAAGIGSVVAFILTRPGI